MRGNCGWCGRWVVTQRQWRYCSRECYFNSLKVPLAFIYKRDKGICHLCRRKVKREDASRDHLRPRSIGGPTNPKNIKLAHRNCNSARGTMPASAYRAILREKRDAGKVLQIQPTG